MELTQQQWNEIRNDFIIKRAKFQAQGEKVKALRDAHERAKAEKKPLQHASKEAYVKFLLAQPEAQKRGFDDTSYPRTDEVHVDLDNEEVE